MYAYETTHGKKHKHPMSLKNLFGQSKVNISYFDQYCICMAVTFGGISCLCISNNLSFQSHSVLKFFKIIIKINKNYKFDNHWKIENLQ